LGRTVFLYRSRFSDYTMVILTTRRNIGQDVPSQLKAEL